MKLVNTSNKLIGIAGARLLPDQSVSITPELAETPAVQAFARTGVVLLIPEDDGQKTNSPDNARAQAEAKAKAEAEAKARAEAEAKAKAEAKAAEAAKKAAEKKAE